MYQKKPVLIILSSIFLLIISLSLCLFIFTKSNSQNTSYINQTTVSLPQAYYSALEDAHKAEYLEISQNLTAIIKDNPRIQWDGDRVKVSTFTDYEGYQKGMKGPEPVDIWVTIVPELKEFCTDYSSSGGDLILRIEQLLGLSPSNKTTKNIIEFWVKSKDLFRPTPDPEISDREAELNFPTSDSFLTVSPEYQNWFNSREQEFQRQLKEMNPDKLSSPWTKLGYTYDWGDPKNHVGLSEFVIRKGANIEVDSVSTAKDYCQPKVS